MGGMGGPKAHFVPPMTSRWKLLKGKLVPINIIGVKYGCNKEKNRRYKYGSL